MSSVNDIPDSWQETTLGEVCKPKGGKRLPKGETLISERTNHPYIRITDFEGNSINKNNLQYVPDETFKKISRYIVDEGDVIISIVGTIGLVALIDDELDNASLTENCVKLTKLESIHNVFLYYYLISKYGQYEIDINTVGAVQKKLPIYGVENINLILPPLTEQKAIANILTAFDDKIENLQAQNKTLEQTAQTIFKEWFGKYQVGDELPDGWSYEKLETIADHIKNNIKPFNHPNKDYLHYSLPAYDNGLVPEIEKGVTIKSNKYEVISKSFLVSKLNPFTPRIWTIFNSVDNHICSTEFQVVKPKADDFFSLIHCFLNSTRFTSVLSQKIKGTSSSHQRVNPQDIFNVNLIVPNETDLEKFNSLANPLIKKKDINHKQIQTLKQTRDTLLPKLMSGQLRVNEFKEKATKSV